MDEPTQQPCDSCLTRGETILAAMAIVAAFCIGYMGADLLIRHWKALATIDEAEALTRAAASGH